MITESFLNSCYALIFSRKAKAVDASVYPDLLHYLNFVKAKIWDEMPIDIKVKFDWLRKLCEYKVSGGTIEEMLVSAASSKQYEQLMDYIMVMQGESIDVNEQNTVTSVVNKVVTFCKLNTTIKRFSEYHDMVTDGKFDLIDDLIVEWRDIVKTASSDVADYELKSRTDLVSSFNTSSGDIDPIIAEIQKKYSTENIIPSGIPGLDESFLSGGFQPSRVHLFGGTSGVGKSLLLLNMAKRAAMSRPINTDPFFWPGVPTLDGPPESVFLYITMENYVYETWIRMYCSMLNKTKDEMLREIFNNKTSSRVINEEIRDQLAQRNTSIQIEYFPAHSISPATISALISKYNEKPCHRSVKAVYVDYLDLLQPDERKELYRLDLGEISSKLKTIAANFEIPIITATQLNREAYKTTKNGEIGSAMISESMQKLFIADFSAMMYWDDITKKDSIGHSNDIPKKVAIKVDKNRDGKTGLTHIYFDYPRSRFITQEEYAEEYEKMLSI